LSSRASSRTDKGIEQVRTAVSKAAGGEIELVKFVRYERGEGGEAAGAGLCIGAGENGRG
jgi:hypothetical protein